MAKDIVLTENLMKRKKIPILIEDDEWKDIFGKDMTRDMKKIVGELEATIKEDREATQQVKICRKAKKNMMAKILQLSDEVNNNNNKEALEKLEMARDKVLQINDQLDEAQFKLETLPKKIEELNMELLKETIPIAYDDIIEGNNRIKELTTEIIKLRDQLKSDWDEKLNLENRVGVLYEYLHHTLGYEETNKLDRQFLKST